MIGTTTIEVVCDLVTDGTHYTPRDVGQGIPFLTVKDVTDQTLDFLGCSFITEEDYRTAKAGNSAPQRGDVLFSKDGTVGKVHVVDTDQPFAVLSSLAILRPKRDIVDPKYFGHVLRSPSVLEDALSRKTGSAIRRVILSDLKMVRIPLPPLIQQQRIAEILDKADALRANRRTALAQIETLTQSIFLDMFGDPATNPKRWPVVSIADISEVRGGKRLPKGEEYSPVPTPFRYIRVLDLSGGRVDESALVYLRPDIQAEISRYVVSTGDVIISIAGSIGLVAPVGQSLNGVNLTENAAKLSPLSPGLYEADYLASYLRSEYAQREIRSYVGQVTIGKLALFRIEKIKLPLPPIQLQQEFVRRAAAVGLLANAQGRAEARIDDLFFSLQERAFQGEL